MTTLVSAAGCQEGLRTLAPGTAFPPYPPWWRLGNSPNSCGFRGFTRYYFLRPWKMDRVDRRSDRYPCSLWAVQYSRGVHCLPEGRNTQTERGCRTRRDEFMMLLKSYLSPANMGFRNNQEDCTLPIERCNASLSAQERDDLCRALPTRGNNAQPCDGNSPFHT